MRTTPGPRQSRECQQARRVHAQGPEAGERTLVTSLIEPESSIALYPTVIVPYAPRRAAPPALGDGLLSRARLSWSGVRAAPTDRAAGRRGERTDARSPRTELGVRRASKWPQFSECDSWIGRCTERSFDPDHGEGVSRPRYRRPSRHPSRWPRIPRPSWPTDDVRGCESPQRRCEQLLIPTGTSATLFSSPWRTGAS